MKKKLLIIMLLFFAFLYNVKAQSVKESFYSAEKIPNIYIKKVKGSTVKYKQARFIRNSNDDSIAYCIQPFEVLKENTNYNGTDTNQAKNAGISDSVWKKISLIAYYGYGYGNHTQDKWYVITQIMIWREIDKDGDFYFTDGLNGSKITTYDNNIKEINTLVNSHYTLPSFASKTYTFSINSKNILEDTNKVLSGFNIISNNSLNISKSNNALEIDTTTPGVETISFEKKFNKYNKKTIVFVDDSYQNIMTPGNIDSLSFNLKISVVGGKIKITKVDADTKEKKELGEGKIIGSIYELLDEERNVVDTLVINEKYEAETSELIPFGNYIIKEKENMKGYLLDEKEYEVTINSDNTNINITLENQVIKSKLELYKYYDEKLESDISFEIYNSNNELMDTLTTDEFGKVEKELYYGTYRFHQLNTTKNYLLVDDFEVVIDENSENVIRLNVYDKKFSSKVIISKVNKKGEIINTSEAIFKVYDLTNNKYVLIDNSPELVTKNGKLVINSLDAGEYELEEIKAPKGYKKLSNKIKFTIDEDNEFTYEELNPVYNVEVENEIIVKVPNTLIDYPQINIIKYYLKKKLTIFC